MEKRRPAVGAEFPSLHRTFRLPRIERQMRRTASTISSTVLNAGTQLSSTMHSGHAANIDDRAGSRGCWTRATGHQPRSRGGHRLNQTAAGSTSTFDDALPGQKNRTQSQAPLLHSAPAVWQQRPSWSDRRQSQCDWRGGQRMKSPAETPSATEHSRFKKAEDARDCAVAASYRHTWPSDGVRAPERGMLQAGKRIQENSEVIRFAPVFSRWLRRCHRVAPAPICRITFPPPVDPGTACSPVTAVACERQMQLESHPVRCRIETETVLTARR